MVMILGPPISPTLPFGSFASKFIKSIQYGAKREIFALGCDRYAVRMGGPYGNILTDAAASCQAFLLLGYDQGVMSGLVGANNEFGKQFNHPNATMQGMRMYL